AQDCSKEASLACETNASQADASSQVVNSGIRPQLSGPPCRARQPRLTNTWSIVFALCYHWEEISGRWEAFFEFHRASAETCGLQGIVRPNPPAISLAVDASSARHGDPSSTQRWRGVLAVFSVRSAVSRLCQRESGRGGGL